MGGGGDGGRGRWGEGEMGGGGENFTHVKGKNSAKRLYYPYLPLSPSPPLPLSVFRHFPQSNLTFFLHQLLPTQVFEAVIAA